MKLLILDVDGVMTDGTKVYDRGGEVISKRFNDKDFTAIKRFQELGVHVCFLSADKNVTEHVAVRRKIPFHYARNTKGVIDKLSWIPILTDTYEVEPREMAYVGDDYYDLPMLRAIMKEGGKGYIPEDACADIKYIGAELLRSKGGGGVVAEIFGKFKSTTARGRV